MVVYIIYTIYIAGYSVFKAHFMSSVRGFSPVVL